MKDFADKNPLEGIFTHTQLLRTLRALGDPGTYRDIRNRLCTDSLCSNSLVEQ